MITTHPEMVSIGSSLGFAAGGFCCKVPTLCGRMRPKAQLSNKGGGYWQSGPLTTWAQRWLGWLEHLLFIVGIYVLNISRNDISHHGMVPKDAGKHQDNFSQVTRLPTERAF